MFKSLRKIFIRDKDVRLAEEASTADSYVPEDFMALANPRPPDALRPDFDPYMTDAIVTDSRHPLIDPDDEPKFTGDEVPA